MFSKRIHNSAWSSAVRRCEKIAGLKGRDRLAQGGASFAQPWVVILRGGPSPERAGQDRVTPFQGSCFGSGPATRAAAKSALARAIQSRPFRPSHPLSRQLLALVLLAVIGLLLSGCSRQTVTAKTEAPPPLRVQTIKLEPRPIEHRVEITGTLLSTAAVDIKTEVQGRLMRLLKEEGDPVQKGELVALQDEANPRLGVQQAEANLETAVAALERVKVMEEHARIEDERAQNLLKSGGITDRDFQAAQMALNDARAHRRLAEAQIEQARQAVAIARKRLDDCRVYSPVSGEIERKYLNQGSYVDGGALLYRVVDNQRLEFESFVSSNDLGRLKEGQLVRFTIPAYPGEAFEARIKTINPAVQATSRSLSVRATVPNAGRKLKAGMFARGWIVTGIQPDGYMVPANAVWRRANQAPFVFLVEQGTAHKREVTIGLEQPEGIEITQGLKPGDEVVTEQYMELADGSRVAPQS